jgi:hypothetical protein
MVFRLDCVRVREKTPVFTIDLGAPSYYALLGVSPHASAREIRSARAEKFGALQRRLLAATDPDERGRIEDEQTALNAAGETLARPEERKKYDEANVQLRFFEVRIAAAPMFAESHEEGLRVVYRALRASVVDQGLPLRPLSDIERFDFPDDETPVPLLDNLLRRG